MPSTFMEGQAQAAHPADNGDISYQAAQEMPPPPPFQACVLEAYQPQCEAPGWASNIEMPKKTRPVPPQLSEMELSQAPNSPGPGVPTWTPQVENHEDPVIPEAPCWTPKVASVATSIPAAAPAPDAPTVTHPHVPIGTSMNAYLPEQYDPFELSKRDLCMGSSVGSCVVPPASQPIIAWYRVSFAGGIALRCGPSVDAARTGGMLYQNQTFAVSESFQGLDGRIYLLLADGRGWAFDDAALMPHDPSVVRGRWQAAPVMPDTAAIPYPAMPYTAPPEWEQPLCQEAFDDDASKKRRRRKRGGVKRNKNKRAQEASGLGAKSSSEAEADTDEPPDASGEADSLQSEVENEGVVY